MEAVELLGCKGARELFEMLRAHPLRQFSINELANESGVPFTTAWKLVQKFERAQVVEVGLIGRTRAVKHKAGPFSKLLADILRLSSSQQALSLPELKRILKAKEGVKAAYLFGSVAQKKERLESDVDIALLMDRKVDLPSFMSEMHEGYGVKVVPVDFHSKAELDGFLKGKKKVRLV